MTIMMMIVDKGFYDQSCQRQLTKKSLRVRLSHHLHHSEHGREPIDKFILHTATQYFIFIFHQRVVKLGKGGKQDKAHVDWGGQRCSREEKYQQEETLPPITFISEEAKCNEKQEDGDGEEW